MFVCLEVYLLLGRSCRARQQLVNVRKLGPAFFPLLCSSSQASTS